MGVIAAADHIQPAFPAPPLADGHPGDLAHRKPVQHGNRQGSDARLVLHVEHRPVDQMPVGIGPVEHDDRTAEFGAGIHHAEHRYIIGVEPQSDVLHIDHQHVERLHRLVRGAFGIAVVERPNRDSRPPVHRVSDMLARIGRSPESVFGRKDPRHIESAAVQQIDQMDRPVGGSPRQTSRPTPGPVRQSRRFACGYSRQSFRLCCVFPLRRFAETRDGGMVRQHGHAQALQFREVGRSIGHADQHRSMRKRCAAGRYGLRPLSRSARRDGKSRKRQENE